MWRRGSSDRSSARQPCPQVLQSHPRVAKGRKSVPLTGLRSGLGPGLARGPCAQVLQRHSGVAKGTSIDPLARGPSTEPLLGQGHVARLSGTGVKPVSCRCFGRTSARHPRREASRWHHGVAKQSSIGSSSIKCRCFMDVEVRIAFLSMKCRYSMDAEVRIGFSARCRACGNSRLCRNVAELASLPFLRNEGACPKYTPSARNIASLSAC